MFAPDLGTDKIYSYRLDAANGKLTANQPGSISVPPGSGPRHFAFSPNGKFAYVVNELANTVIAFQYDANVGGLKEIQNIRTVPADFQGANTAAEIQVHPSGKYLYASNRGHDSIAVFAVDPESGLLTAKAYEPALGKTPRNFRIDPTGRWLIAAHQTSGTIVLFRIDPSTGDLSPAGVTFAVPAAVCVKFVAEE